MGMKENTEEFLKLINDLKFEDAISHSIHSRIFEILGYMELIKKESIPEDALKYLNNIEILNKKLIKEIHLIIDLKTKKDPDR
jgi:hypothetical protein